MSRRDLFFGDWQRKLFLSELNMRGGGICRTAFDMGMCPDFLLPGNKKKNNKKKIRNGIPEGLVNDGQSRGDEIWKDGEWSGDWQDAGTEEKPMRLRSLKEAEEAEMQEAEGQPARLWSLKEAEEAETQEAEGQLARLYSLKEEEMQETEEVEALKQPPQGMQLQKKRNQGKERENSGNGMDSAGLQEIMTWMEILGDPVSVKRRKRRNSYYGNQGNAYRG